MFKIISEFVEKPQMMALCDRACGQYALVPMPFGPTNATLDQQEALWARELQKQGWRISLREHVCPMHVKKDAGEERLIVIPALGGSSFKN